VVKTPLNVKIEIEMAQQIRELLKKEQSAASQIGLSASPNFSDLTRMLLKKGLAERWKELHATTNSASTQVAKPPGR
jgi:hypothetical protein